jgi:hypothetical protein
MTSTLLLTTLMGWLAAVRLVDSKVSGADSLRATLRDGIVIGACCMLLAFWGAPALGLVVGQLTASDFDQYCAAVASVRLGELDAVPPQRGVAGALVPAVLSGWFGVVDGLFVSALLTQLLGTVGLVVWARASFGRGMGAVAGVVVATFAPWAVMGRLLTFHGGPLALAFVGMAAVALAARFQKVGGAAVGILVAAGLLWLDVRGWVWALPLTALSLIVGWCIGDGRQRWGLAAWTGLVFCASWSAAAAVVPPSAPGFEQQTLRMLEEQARLAGAASGLWQQALDRTFSTEFLWGHRGAGAALGSLKRLMAVRPFVPAWHDPRFDGLAGPWQSLAVGAWCVAVPAAALRRRWVALVGLVLSLPALATLALAHNSIAHPRYLAMATPGLVAGVLALVAVFSHPPGRPSRTARLAPSWVPLVGGVVGLALVLGVPPTPMAAGAAWRQVQLPESEPRDTLLFAANGGTGRRSPSPRCLEALAQDHTRGLPWGSRLLGWDVTAGESGAEPWE